MKECNLVNCAIYHEGYCTWDLKECKATKDSDLITEEEFDLRVKGEGNG